MDTLYGFKIGQSQDFDAAGVRVPVTLVRLDPNVVVGTNNRALRVVVGVKKHPNKPFSGILKNLSEKITPRFMREIKISEGETSTVGTKLGMADIFNAGDMVKVAGLSKGKGFAGVVKRHGFRGGPKTHGQSNRQRHAGSIGQTTTPGRVYRGKRMAGHMGDQNVTVRNLQIFAVKPEENLLMISGLVPGGKGGLLKITKI